MKLLSEHEDVLAEFNSGQVAVPQDSEDGWTEVMYKGAWPGTRGGAWQGAGPVIGGQGHPYHTLPILQWQL